MTVVVGLGSEPGLDAEERSKKREKTTRRRADENVGGQNLQKKGLIARWVMSHQAKASAA